jgi:hypothetical protein
MRSFPSCTKHALRATWRQNYPHALSCSKNTGKATLVAVFMQQPLGHASSPQKNSCSHPPEDKPGPGSRSSEHQRLQTPREARPATPSTTPSMARSTDISQFLGCTFAEFSRCWHPNNVTSWVLRRRHRHSDLFGRLKRCLSDSGPEGARLLASLNGQRTSPSATQNTPPPWSA